DGSRVGEMKAAVADDLHDSLLRPGQPGTQRHAAAESQAPAGEPDIALRSRALNLIQHGKAVADAFVDHDVVRSQRLVQRGANEVRRKRADAAGLGAGCRHAFTAFRALRLPARDALRGTLAKSVIG